LTWNLLRFFPEYSRDFYVEFQDKTILGEFFQKFLHLPILPKLVKFRSTFWNIYSASVLHWRNSHEYFHMFIAPRYGGTSIKESQIEDTGRISQDVLFSENKFCFRKTSFAYSQCETYYALLLGCFGLKSLPDIRHCVYWVLAEISAPDSSHKIGNKLFIDHCQGWKEGSFVCETVWFFSWVNTHPFDLQFVAFCPEFSGDSYVEFQEKTISGEFFRNFRTNKGYYPLPKLVKFRPTFWNFYYASVLRWKKSHKYFHKFFLPR